MKIRVDQIPDGGVEVEVEDQAWAVQATAAAFDGAEATLTGTIHVEAFDDQVRVTGSLRATTRRACDRCGMDLDIERQDAIELHYVPRGSRDGGESRNLKKDELDIGFYDVGALDLAFVIEEHFALSLPTRLACDAPGTRVADGEPCGAPDPGVDTEKPVDPRFAALAGLKLN